MTRLLILHNRVGYIWFSTDVMLQSIRNYTGLTNIYIDADVMYMQLHR